MWVAEWEWSPLLCSGDLRGRKPLQPGFIEEGATFELGLRGWVGVWWVGKGFRVDRLNMQTQALQWEASPRQSPVWTVELGSLSQSHHAPMLCSPEARVLGICIFNKLPKWCCHACSRCYRLRKCMNEWMNFKKWTWPQASPFFSQDVHSLLK